MDENNKKFPKRNIVLYVSIAVILVSLTFRASYAYFVSYLTNNTTPTSTVVNTGDLSMKFEDGSTYINAQDMMLMTEEEALRASNNYSRFTVTNDGNITGNYKIYLSNYSISSNLVSRDFKWRLKIDDTILTGNFYDLFKDMTPNASGIITGSSIDIPINSNSVSLPVGESDNCEFRVWIEETQENQIGLTEGTFSTTLRLIATN